MKQLRPNLLIKMRKTALYLLLTLGIAHAQDQSVARFSNGDKLSGSLVSLGLDDLVWKSEILEKPAKFDLKYVVDLSMPTSLSYLEDGDTPGHEATLELTNGDKVKGQLAGLTDDEIRLKTWYAGELTFRRVIVDTVKITRSSEVFYRGPTGIEEWSAPDDSNNWSFKAGSLVSDSAGSIARNIDFPKEAKISFEASWQGSFRPRIIFFSDDINSSSPKQGYEMVFQENSVHVKKVESNSWLGHSTNARVLKEQEKAKIEIRVSKESGKILLYIDDTYIDMWEDIDVNAEGLGKGLHFIAQDATPLAISNIVVSEWDGYTENIPQKQNQFRGRVFRGGWDVDDGRNIEQETKEEEISDGRMILLNGDSIKGEVLGIENEIIRLKTPLTEVSFPVARLKNVVLKEADMETPKRYKGDVRATLADGSRLVFRLDRVNGDTLVGFSQNFGEAEFSKDAFKRIEFNIYDGDLDYLRSTN